MRRRKGVAEKNKNSSSLLLFLQSVFTTPYSASQRWSNFPCRKPGGRTKAVYHSTAAASAGESQLRQHFTINRSDSDSSVDPGFFYYYYLIFYYIYFYFRKATLCPAMLVVSHAVPSEKTKHIHSQVVFRRCSSRSLIGRMTQEDTEKLQTPVSSLFFFVLLPANTRGVYLYSSSYWHTDNQPSLSAQQTPTKTQTTLCNYSRS